MIILGIIRVIITIFIYKEIQGTSTQEEAIRPCKPVQSREHLHTPLIITTSRYLSNSIHKLSTDSTVTTLARRPFHAFTTRNESLITTILTLLFFILKLWPLVLSGSILLKNYSAHILSSIPFIILNICIESPRNCLPSNVSCFVSFSHSSYLHLHLVRPRINIVACMTL